MPCIASCNPYRAFSQAVGQQRKGQFLCGSFCTFLLFLQVYLYYLYYFKAIFYQVLGTGRNLVEDLGVEAQRGARVLGREREQACVSRRNQMKNKKIESKQIKTNQTKPTREENVENDTAGPDVRLAAVQTQIHFRSHVFGCALFGKIMQA